MKETLLKILGEVFGPDAAAIAIPDGELFGHYATNWALRAAKERGVPPLELAKEYATKIAAAAPESFFHKVEAAAPGFINFWLSNKTIQEEFARIAGEKKYGDGIVGKGKTVIVEYSSPNIAKPMHLGHMRTTIIGSALANILEASGSRVVRWNYLGDWGTQFGKLIAAYKMWGDKDLVEKYPIEELQKLYVRFHEEMKTDPALEKRGQDEFRKLEEGDHENRALWQWFKKESLKEFERIYATLGVDFDVWIGESFFEDELKPVVKELTSKGIAERSEGSIVVKLDDAGLPVALIEKSDGASLYLTRDIANLRYRLKKYHPARILYVVGNEQALYFEQLFAVAKKLGLDGAELVHIKYGLVLGASGKKLSTREGTAQMLDDVLKEAVAKAREVIEAKNSDLPPREKEEVASVVAIGALKYNDLKENRTTDIIFDWEKMLDFSGDSAPYLQYTYARLKSILRKAQDTGLGPRTDARSPIPKFAPKDAVNLEHTSEIALMLRLFEFPDAVLRASELYSTSTLATYLYRLAVAANKFYETTPILKDEDVAPRAARLALAATAARTLQKGLGLLGIKTLEKI
jgi:arginyl-tRNA synthetase